MSSEVMSLDHWRRIKNIICLFPDFTRIDIMKDYGQIPFHLAKLGYTVKILTYLNNSNKELQIDKVELVRMPGINLYHPYFIDFPLLYYISKNRRNIDCIFASFTVSNVVISLVYKLLRNGVFIIKMDSDGRLYRGNLVIRTIKRLIGSLIFRLSSFCSNLLIIESPEAMNRLLYIHPWLKKKLVMLPNGVDQDRLEELSKPIEGQKNKRILSVGRVEYGKGTDLLITAFSRLKDKYPEWTLELVGEIVPSFKAEIERLISNLKGRVALTGPLYGKDLVKEYMQAEIFCFPSRGFHSLGPESFGLVLLEAMYFSNAIISSDTGAAEYLLHYGNAGLIFKNGDVDELAIKLEMLIKDENLRKKLARNARLRCEELFDWDKIIKELDCYIRSVESNKG